MSHVRKGRLIQVQPRTPKRILPFQFNPEQVIRTGGYGGWEALNRPLGKPVTEWRGRSAIRLTFQLFLDGWPEGWMINGALSWFTVERYIQNLEAMATPRAPNEPPPIIRFDYGPPVGDRLWVIDDIGYGKEVRNTNLDRVQAELNFTLTEYQSAKLTLTPAQRAKDRIGKAKRIRR